MKKLLILLLTVFLISQHAVYASGAKISDWAMDEVQAAIQIGLVPEEMQCDYQSNMTRAEFAKLSVVFVAHHLSMEIDEAVEWYLCGHTDSSGKPLIFQKDTFTDIIESEYEYYIQCANSMGIVNGRGNRIFDPDSFITREEAATMLLRVYFCYGSGVKLNAKSEEIDGFYDAKEISSWADSAVRYLYQWDVMKGVSEGCYAPKEYYTKEQCYITFFRLQQVYSYR